MERTTRTYGHFCMVARALEQVGDRWTLLVVRDLLGGPRRFTDLMGLLGGITPKTLSQRLRELESAGIVAVDRQAGRREVWYRLTPAGEELAPAVDALFLWGVRHARRPPLPGEHVHPEHLLKALRTLVAHTTPPRHPLVWLFDFADDGTYTLAYDGDTWTLTNGVNGAAPDVTIATDTEAWTRYVTTPVADRSSTAPGVELTGRRPQIEAFQRLMARLPEGDG